jgi:hypothetical protein
MTAVRGWMIYTFIFILVGLNPHKRTVNAWKRRLTPIDQKTDITGSYHRPTDINLDQNLLVLSKMAYVANAGSVRNVTRLRPSKLHKDYISIGLLLLLLAGDVATNPGPRKARNPCGTCGYAVSEGRRAILCDLCNLWCHFKCVPEMTVQDYNKLSLSDDAWHCPKCSTVPPEDLFDFTDSFFINSRNDSLCSRSPTPSICIQTLPFTNNSVTENDITFESLASDQCSIALSDSVSETSEANIDEEDEPFLPELMELRKKHMKNLIFAHININSLRSKYTVLLDVLHRELIDIFTIQETKLDNSFPDAQFQIPGYRMYRG